MYIFLNVSGIWSYSEHLIIIFERPENILSEKKIADVPKLKTRIILAEIIQA